MDTVVALRSPASGWLVGVRAVALAALVTMTGQAAAPTQASESDIVDTAVAAGSFTTLATALQAAGLVDTLKSDGPFTVFAPTDAAFAMLPAGTVEQLLANPDALRSVLTYHVVPGAVGAADVVNLTSATTVQGQQVNIATMDGAVQINQANVQMADVMASNGIIHVIDAVLLPPTEALAPAEHQE